VPPLIRIVYQNQPHNDSLLGLRLIHDLGLARTSPQETGWIAISSGLSLLALLVDMLIAENATLQLHY